jgi:hypothetical protein
VTPSQVFALRPAAGGYRTAWARERLADSFRPIPTAFMLAGGLIAAGVVFTLTPVALRPASSLASPQVARRLPAAYDVIETGLKPSRRRGLNLRRDALLRRSAELGITPERPRPDPLGLG